jgi:putative salt-induced outer membrane protein
VSIRFSKKGDNGLHNNIPAVAMKKNSVHHSIQNGFLVGSFVNIVILAAVMTSDVNAQEKSAEPAKTQEPDPYKGNVELGYVNTSGNTKTQTLNAKAKVEASYDKWRQTLQLEALNSSDNDVTTAERYTAALKSDYRFSKRDYAFGLLNYENDRFSGYDYRTSISVGYGRRVIDTKPLWLELEGGPGYRFSKLSDDGDQDEAILRLAGSLGWQISESALFEQTLSSEIGEDATISKSVSALSMQIIGSLAMKLSYTYRYVTDVPEGVQKKDTETSATLVYKF